MNKLWILFGFLSSFFAALVAIFGKIGIKDLDTTLATTVRAIVMAIFLILTSLFLKKFSLIEQVNSKSLLFIILAGISGALSWLFYFLALKWGEVKTVAVLDRFSVVLVIILSGLLLGEIITFKNWIGIALIAAGLLFFII